MPVYLGQEAVSGYVDIVVNPGKKIEHLGIKIEIFGQIGNNSSFFKYDILADLGSNHFYNF